MAEKYFEVSISAENTAQADQILNSLLEQNLVTGGQIIQAPARFLWKGDVTDMEYVVIKSFTTSTHKDRIIEDVRKQSVEEVPMVWFSEIEGNTELLEWISATLAD